MKMTNNQLHNAIHYKAYSKIMNIELAINSLRKEKPYGVYTQEMIDNQIRFHSNDLQVWKKILELNG